MKIDIAMWAKNGSHFLPLTLKRIDESFPHEFIGNKIFIDDHSEDESTSIAKEFNWEVYLNEKSGIGNGANLALEKIKTPLFASFEQDILLAKNWFDRLYPQIEKPKVAVVQGWRYSTNLTLNALEKYEVETYGANNYWSIDNNLYRTAIVKLVGGFPSNVKYHVDAILRKKIIEARWQWINDAKVASVHIKPGRSFFYAKRNYLAFKEVPDLSKVRILSNESLSKLTTRHLYFRIIRSPLVGFKIALKMHQPILAVYFPISLFYSLKGILATKTNPL